MRTIALRLTGTAASAEELEADGEEIDGMIQNVSKLRDVIMQATKVDSNNNKGIDILNDVGAYKSTYDILLEIAEIYDEIVEKDKQYGTKQANLLLETIAGKNRASIAASILQSPEMLKEAYAEATDAEGSAAIENEKYMNSVEGHLIKLKNAWEELWANVSTREFVNGVIDLGTGLLEIVNHLGIIRSTLVALGALDIVKWMFMGSSGKKSSLFGGLVNSLLQFNSRGGFKSLIGKATTEGGESVASSGFLSQWTSDAVEGGIASSGIGKIVGNIGSSIKNLLPIVGYLALIAGAIAAIHGVIKLVKGYMDYKNYSDKETREEAKNLVDDYRTERKNTSTHKQKIDEVSDRYVELTRGVNLANNQNLTLTNEEYSEYLSICNDIAEMYPRLVSGYDAQGNAILKLKGNVEQLTEAYKQEQVESARTLLQGGENKEDAKSIWDNFVHQREGTWMQKHAAAGMYADEEKEYLDSLFNDYLRDAEGTQKQIENVFNAYFSNGGQGNNDKDITNRYSLLKSLGFSRNMSDAEFEDAMIRLQTESEDIKLKIEENEQFVREMIQARAEVNETYQNMTEDDQQMINSIFGNISKEKLYEYTPDDSGYAKITQDVNSTIETVNQALNSNESVFDEQWQNILNQDNLDYVIDDYENSLNKLEELGYKQQDVIDLINQDAVKVGNVNLSTDRAIDWGEDPTKNENFANLQTWYNKSAEELAKEFKNTTSTVLGTSEEFTFGDNEKIELSFAMVTEDGKILTQDTVDQYINNIIHTANENGEPITIDTILKYDSKENGGMNIIAGEGENASSAMHEIEVLKGFGNIEGAYKTLDDLAQKTGHSIDDFITEYYKLGSLKDINTFRDVYADMLGLGSGKGNLANAKSMGEFEEIANTYRQIFIDQMGEDTGAEIFDSIFDDQGRGDLTKRFDSMLRRNWRLNPNSPEYQKYMGQFKGMSYDQAKAYTNAFSRITKLDEGQINQEFSKSLRDTAAGAYQATLNIEEEAAAINSLNSAIASSNGATGLSSEEVTNVEALYKDLAGYDASELFESTANGIHLNQKELRRLNKEYQKSRVKQQSKQYDELQKRLSESEKALYDLQQRYKKDPSKDSLIDEINAENRRKEGIEENINALEREMAQYSALTSAYNQYVNAQSSANENAKYENIQTGYDTAKDLINRGWGGQDDVRAYVNMFSTKDMMTAPVDEVIARFNELDDKIANTSYSMKDFFTVDENGKSTNTGIFNFLDVVKAKFKETAQTSEDYKDFTTEEINSIADQLVTVTDDGRYSFDFNVLGGDQKVADMLGVDISLLQAIVQAAQDAGFEIQMSNALPGMDAVIQHVGEMKQELIDLGVEADKIKEYDFTLELGTIDANTELDEDEKIEQYVDLAKKIQEAKESVKVDEDLSPEQQAASLEYLNAQLDATIQKAALAKMQMTFGNLDISSWQADYQVLGTLMQDYYEKSSELAIKKEVGLDCSDATKSCDEARDALAEYLAEAFTAKELGEMGFELPVNFDTESPQKQIELLKEQLEEDNFELEINPTITDPTGDPTKGLDNQHIVIDVQFTMDGKTVVIEAINTVTEAAEGVPTDTTTTAHAETQQAENDLNNYDSTVEELDGKEIDNPLISNVKEKFKETKSYSGLLRQTNGLNVKNTFTTSGLNSALTASSSLLSNFARLSKTFTTTHITKYINKNENTSTSSSSKGKKGGPRFNGTAHAQGTISKFAQRNAYVNGTYSGDWGVPQDEDALVNELGEEIIIHDGKWRIANNGNMGFTHLRKGDVVLNHKQTEELLKNGYVSNSRAKLIGGMSHVDGTIGDALSKGSTKTNGVKRTTPKKTSSGKTNSNNGKKSGGGNNNSNKKSNNNNNNNNTAETFDWVEVKIQRIEEAIAQLDTVMDSVYNTWGQRNSALENDLKKVKEEVDLQRKAITTYNDYLKKIGLKEDYAKKVREGKLQIEDIKNDKLKEKIQKYQEYYNKVVQCQTSITELIEREKELAAQRFDNKASQYDNRLQQYDTRIEAADALSDKAEKMGRLMTGYYEGIMRTAENKRLERLREEYDVLLKEFNNAVDKGKIAKWSEQWYEMASTIDEVNQSIIEAEASVIEHENAMRQYNWDRFDNKLERIEAIAEEAEWIGSLLEEGKSFEEETGEYTKLGSARMGMLAIQYDTYLNESARYAAELKNIEKDIAQDPYNQDLLDRRKELLEAQRDAISNALKERDAIKSLIEEGIEAQLDALQKLIDRYKEALQSQKDLYDYQNNVTENADEISRLQKLISAYQGDDSEESRLKVQQYQKELKDAQKSLYDTQYDRNISDTEEALDKLYEQYEETLNNALDDVDKLIADVIRGVNSGSQNIVQTIKDATDKYGYTLTTSMDTIANAIGSLASGTIKKDINSSDTGQNISPESGVDTASNQVAKEVNKAVSNAYNQATEEFETEKRATSAIEKSAGLSGDGKSYTYSDGTTVQFKTDATKGGFVNGTDGKQYYFDSSGMVGIGGGLQTIKGFKYYTDEKGALQTGWQQVGDKWYYFYKSTIPKYTGKNGNHYKGVAATDWQNIKDEKDGKTYLYYFDKNGVMQSNRWKDRTVGGKVYRYWLKKNGRVFQNGSFSSGKTTYYFSKDGYLLDKKGGKPKVFSKIQYKTGVYGLTQDQLAWTQENKKEEAIIRPSDGAILTPLSHGDSVLNAKATKALFEFANNPDEYFKSYTDGSNYNDVPTINNTMNGDMNIQFNINGANITDYDTFKKQLTSDPQFERLLRSMTTDRLFGGSSLKKYKI